MNRLVPDNVYHPLGGMNLDSNGVNIEPSQCVDAVNVSISQSDFTHRFGTTLLGESGQDEPLEDVLEYATYEDPVLGTILFALCSESIYRFIAGTGWAEKTGYDGEGGGLLEGSLDIDQWSTAKCIDEMLGVTLVACGSQYVGSTEPMEGGSSRILIYYDRVADIFKELELTSVLQVSAEDSGLEGPATETSVTGTLGVLDPTDPEYNSDFVSVEPGTFLVRTTIDGVLALSGIRVVSLPVGEIALGDASDGADVDCYQLIPADDTVAKYGGGSWIRVDGLKWSLEFVSTDYQDTTLLLDYDYAYEVEYRPTYIANFQNALIMANTYEGTTYHPWRLRWSYQGNIFKTLSYYYQDLAVDSATPITGLLSSDQAYYNEVASYLFISKPDSIIRASYNRSYNLNPDLPLPFLAFDTACSKGVGSRRTWVKAEKNQIFMGEDDVYGFDGVNHISLTLTNERATRIRKYLFDNLNLDRLDKNFAVYNPIKKEYMLFVCLNSSATDTPIDCFVYNTELGIWSRNIYPETQAGLVLNINPSGSIDDLGDASIDSLGDTLIEDLSGNTIKRVITAMGAESHVHKRGLYDKSGTESPVLVVPYLITKDFIGQSLEHMDRSQLLHIEGRSGIIAVLHSGSYDTNPDLFLGKVAFNQSSGFVRSSYHPDMIAYAIRYCIILTNFASVRWIQNFSVRQELINE
jgi:hypothetical protein